jgi:hypothetical protein
LRVISKEILPSRVTDALVNKTSYFTFDCICMYRYYTDLLLRHIQLGNAGLVPIIRSGFLLVQSERNRKHSRVGPISIGPVAIVDLFNKMHEVEFI